MITTGNGPPLSVISGHSSSEWSDFLQPRSGKTGMKYTTNIYGISNFFVATICNYISITIIIMCNDTKSIKMYYDIVLIFGSAGSIEPRKQQYL